MMKNCFPNIFWGADVEGLTQSTMGRSPGSHPQKISQNNFIAILDNLWDF